MVRNLGALLIAFFGQNLNSDGNGTASDKAKFFSGSDGNIDDAASFKGTAIVDGDDLGFIVG